MLSREDNERLVRVGPGTPMGALMRLHWIPFLRSGDVQRDGQPHRVRLLGEDLVAFRDSQGLVGLVNHACPHRAAPMVFARNEEGGLRCVYHGWKFGVGGECLDIATEPHGSPLCKTAKIKAYPVRERNGMLWAWMGGDADPPPLPSLEWNLVPAEQVHVSMRIQECNWLQALEGEIDSAHAAILHARVDHKSSIDQWRQAQDLLPRFECVQHASGVHIAARRKAGEADDYVRVNQFLLPFYTLVPPQSQYPELSGHAWVPVDDEHTLCLMFTYHPAQPLPEKSLKMFREGHQGWDSGHPADTSFEPRPVTHPYPMFWPIYNRGNAYRFDHGLQVTKRNSGMPGLWVQDAAAQSGVQAITDRSQEKLGTTDLGIVRTRRLLLDAMRQFEAEGTRPASATEPEALMWRAVSITIPRGSAWRPAAAEVMRARLGAGFGYTP
jgi:phenylpropionate dioxygenase-like ring-hydroxylating dioxygenase large terminal subunit